MARKKGQISKFFVGILMLLLIVGLAGFGAGNFGGQIRSIGTVGDVEIDVDEYARALQEELRAIQAQTGQPLSLDQARQFGVDTQVMQRLIATAALENETNRIGLSVGDSEVQRQLLATPGFRGLDGEFDRESYEYSLERNNLNATEYEASIRSQTAGTILQSAILSGIDAPSAYSDVILDYLGERRSFSWMELNEQSLNTLIPAPTDAELQTYFAENGANYTLPASRQITFALLSPDAVMDQITVEEDVLQALYNDRSEEYNTPERRLVERLVFADMAAAQAAHDSITAGETSFEATVTERGLNLADIDLGDVTKSSLGSAGDAVFALTEPGLTGAVQSDLGPSLFRVNAILSARSTPYADARAILFDEVAADNARRLVADQIAEMDDLLAGGVTLEELVDETDMELGQIDWVAGSSEGIAAYDGFASAAARVTDADFPAIETLEDGGIFALRLDSELAERPDSFENSVTAVTAHWRRDALTQALEDTSAVLLATLSGGARLSSLGYPVTVETEVKRDAVNLAQPTGFLEAVFGLASGASTTVSAENRILLIQLGDVLVADPNDPDRAGLRSAINDSVSQGVGQDALSAFSRALQQKAGISLNQVAINAVHSQFASTSPTSGGHDGTGN